MQKLYKIFSLICLVSFLVSCSAIDKQVRHGKLEVITKMSDTIFLDPVGEDKRTIFIKIRNTSGYESIHIDQEISSALAAKGYKIVSDPDKAHYVLQANILQVGKVKDGDFAFSSLSGGYGAAVGAVAAIGMSDRPGLGNVAAGALLGGAVEYLADVAVQVCYYSITTDIQISEHSEMGEVKVETKTHQGKDNAKLTYSEKSDRKKYNTRIVSLAKKTNLKFEEAEPEITKGLVSAISGMF